MLFPCSLFRASAALLALGALPLSAAEQPDPAQSRPVVSITDLNPVRLTRDAHSKLLVAQCTINGVPCNLIVDTAASHTTFDIKFIKKNFPGLPLENAQIAPGSNVNTVPQLFAMKSFSIGGLHIKNFFGLAMDLTPLQKDMKVRVDGILGINYLGFSPFLLSVRDASLQFLERSRFPSQNMKPLEVERHPSGIFYVRCSRGGDAFLLALDSGSSLSLAPLEQWPADPNGNQLTAKASDINGHSGDRNVMKLGIPSTLRMGPDFQMDGLSFAVTGTGGRCQIGVDTLQHFDIIIDAPQGEVFALPLHSKPEARGQKAPAVKRES